VSDRYVGSIGPGGLYSNRGYGFALRLHDSGLDQRWLVIDPANPDAAPPNRRPVVHDEPLDLDGDGKLAIGETVHFLTPVLRLLSKTSTGAEITLDVDIVHPKNKKAPIEDFVIPEIRKLTRTASIAGQIQQAMIGGIWDARIAESEPPPPGTQGTVYRIALIDQPELVAEEGIKRRQIVRVVLRAPQMTDALRKDLELFLGGLILNRFAGEQSDQERW
jgi:hypothetical protein